MVESSNLWEDWQELSGYDQGGIKYDEESLSDVCFWNQFLKYRIPYIQQKDTENAAEDVDRGKSKKKGGNKVRETKAKKVSAYVLTVR
jgi:hypothetical protein